MRRFNRRMCGDKETFNRYSELSPRPLEEIKEELEFYIIRSSRKSSNQPITISTFWDQAILSTEDKIFGNQPPEFISARPLPHPRDQGASSSFTTINHGIMEVIE